MWNDSHLPSIPTIDAAHKQTARALLVKAKTFLWDGHETDLPTNASLCFALMDAAEDKDIKALGGVDDVMRQLRSGISEALGDHAFATTYLAAQLDIDRDLLDWVTVQSYRHRWLDLMIESLEK